MTFFRHQLPYSQAYLPFAALRLQITIDKSIHATVWSLEIDDCEVLRVCLGTSGGINASAAGRGRLLLGGIAEGALLSQNPSSHNEHQLQSRRHRGRIQDRVSTFPPPLQQEESHPHWRQIGSAWGRIYLAHLLLLDLVRSCLSPCTFPPAILPASCSSSSQIPPVTSAAGPGSTQQVHSSSPACSPLIFPGLETAQHPLLSEPSLDIHCLSFRCEASKLITSIEYSNQNHQSFPPPRARSQVETRPPNLSTSRIL